MNETSKSPSSGLNPETEKLRQRMAKLAWLLDNSIRIPVINYRIGLDAIVGLIPGIGDATGALMSGYIFYSAVKMKAPFSVLSRAALNIVIELVVGMVPVVGDIFDATFKANARNMDLINAWLDQPKKTQQQSKLLLGGLGGGVILLLLAGVVTGVLLLLLVIRMLAALF